MKNAIVTTLVACSLAFMLALPTHATEEDPDWLNAMRQFVPPDAIVEVIVQRDLDELQAFGLDMATGAWYRYIRQSSNGTAFIPGSGMYASVISNHGLQLNDTWPRQDAVLDRSVMSWHYLSNIVRHPECVKDAFRSTDGTWTLVVEGPAGDPTYDPRNPIFQVRVEVNADGRVFMLHPSNEREPRVLVPASIDLGAYNVNSPEWARWKVVESSIKPPLPGGRPAWTIEEINAKMIRFREMESQMRMAAAEQAAAKTPAPVPPSTPNPDFGVKPTTTARSGNALVISGIALLAVGALVWWRNRSAA